MSDDDYYGDDMGNDEDYADYYDEGDYQDEQNDDQQEDYHEQMEEEIQEINTRAISDVKVIPKNIVEAKDQSDVIDFLISDHKDHINQLTKQIEELLLNKEDMQLIFVRIAKLFNEIKRRLGKMNTSNGWKFDKNEIEDLNVLIELTFRFLYVYQFSSIENLIDKTLQLKMDFDKAFTKQIMNLLLKSDEYAESIPFVFVDNLKKIFVFCLNPPEPFITQEDNVFTNISNQVLDIMGSDPTYLVFDTLILAYFSNPAKMSKLLAQSISQVTSQLESYLNSTNQALQLNEQLLVQKMIQLLIFVSSSDAKILQMLIDEELHKRLYDTVKFSDVSFSSNDKKQWSSDARLIQSIVILIRVILSGKKTGDKKFAQTLLDDFLFLINQNRFQFIYSIIVPILTTNDTQYIPFCLHKEWDMNSAKQFNDYLKDISIKSASANQILSDSKVPTDLFDDRQREYFHSTFLKTGIWRKIMTIDRDNPVINIEKTLPILEGEPQNLFIFNCTYQGQPMKYGVYVKNKIDSIKNQMANVLDKSSKNLKGLSTDESFFFYMDKERNFHIKSNQRKIKKPVPGQKMNYNTEQDPFQPNTKDLIKIEYSGISFFLDEEIVIYINFGNIDLSKFDIPFSQLQIEDAYIKSSKLNSEEIQLESAEIWRLELENTSAKIDSYLQMFTQKEDLQSIYITYLKYFRLEKISILPHYITINSFIENFIHADHNNKKIVKSVSSKFESNLPLTQNIKSFEYIFEGSNSNKTLDLIIPNNQANLLKLPFEEELGKLYEVNKSAKNLIIDVFQNNSEGITKIFEVLDKEAQKRYAQNLIVFFFDALKFLNLPNFVSHLIIQKDFFKIILSLLFTQEQADSKIGIQNFHQAVYLLFKALKRLLKYDKSGELRGYCLKRNILQDILSKFEIYNGTLSKKLRKKVVEQKQEQKVNTNTTASLDTGAYSGYGSNSSNLSKKGVGYGHGSSDTSWMNNYSSGYSTAVVEGATQANYNHYNNYQQPAQQQPKTNSFVLGLKEKSEASLIFNDPNTIRSYLGQEFISKILKQLSGCLEYLFDLDINFDISAEVYQKIKLSTLNPILIKVFDTNSLLDSTKRATFFKPVMNLFQNIAKNDELLDFFIWRDDYQDRMEGSNKMVDEEKSEKCLYSLLSSMRDQAEFFEKNLLNVQQNEVQFENMKLTQAQKQEKIEEAQSQSQIIKLCIKTFEVVEKALKDNDYISIKEVEDSNKANMSQFETGKMHIEQFYNLLLKPLCVQGAPTVSFKHHYSNYFTTGTPSSVKMQRLIKEISDLTHSLPMTYQSSIFCRYDSSRMDIMKSLIFGAEDTPYAHGAFVFDMFFDDTYPQNSPKVNLATTGNNLIFYGEVFINILTI